MSFGRTLDAERITDDIVADTMDQEAESCYKDQIRYLGPMFAESTQETRTCFASEASCKTSAFPGYLCKHRLSFNCHSHGRQSDGDTQCDSKERRLDLRGAANGGSPSHRLLCPSCFAQLSPSRCGAEQDNRSKLAASLEAELYEFVQIVDQQAVPK